MLWRKPEGLKYTDLCIFVDKHADEITNPGENPVIEETVYNYIWLLIKAIAIKQRMFEKFDDYDGYALYGATRIYLALRRSRMNAGKTVKGRVIVPIKSVLNYTKALLYPMKLEYLHEQYKIEKGADAANVVFTQFTQRQMAQESTWDNAGGDKFFKFDINLLFSNFSAELDAVLKKSPVRIGSAEYQRLKISILMNCLNNLKAGKGFNADPPALCYWRLPKSMGNYIRLYIKELGTHLKQDIVESYNNMLVDDRIIDYIIANPTGEVPKDDARFQ